MMMMMMMMRIMNFRDEDSSDDTFEFDSSNKDYSDDELIFLEKG